MYFEIYLYHQIINFLQITVGKTVFKYIGFLQLETTIKVL